MWSDTRGGHSPQYLLCNQFTNSHGPNHKLPYFSYHLHQPVFPDIFLAIFLCLPCLCALSRLSYIPQQRWLEAWFAATAASLPRCEPLQLSTMALVLGEWGVVPAHGFAIDFWRVTKCRCAGLAYK